MRRRLYLLLLAVAVGIALGWWLNHRRVPEPAAPRVAPAASLRAPMPALASISPPAPTAPAVVTTPARLAPPLPPPVIAPAPRTEVPIQDGKTIDFSSGKPVVKDSSNEQAIINAAVKEMDAAAKNVRFSPTPAPTPAPEEKKKPATAPPTESSGG